MTERRSPSRPDSAPVAARLLLRQAAAMGRHTRTLAVALLLGAGGLLALIVMDLVESGEALRRSGIEGWGAMWRVAWPISVPLLCIMVGVSALANRRDRSAALAGAFALACEGFFLLI